MLSMNRVSHRWLGKTRDPKNKPKVLTFMVHQMGPTGVPDNMSFLGFLFGIPRNQKLKKSNREFILYLKFTLWYLGSSMNYAPFVS